MEKRGILNNMTQEEKWLAKYNAPLKLCVNSNQSRVRKGQNISVDVHIINEVDLKGPQKLVVELWNLEGGERKLAEERRDVSVTGGERFGEFLSEKISFTSEKIILSCSASEQHRSYAAARGPCGFRARPDTSRRAP